MYRSKTVKTSSPEVQTEFGRVEGLRYDFTETPNRPVNAFLGIPYAKPPNKPELRFKKPQPLEPWEGKRLAQKFGPRCIQKGTPSFCPISFFAPSYGPTSEDCLYLNVFAPGWSQATETKYPVMVFIHGGGFVSDSSVKYGSEGISKTLVAKREIIVVTIQYRLGLLGFFATGDDACDENVGLWDMTAAIGWVKNNISHFGGDSGNITLLGQSAGAVSVDLLSLSPHSRDLFQKVIIMAGCSECKWAISKNSIKFCRDFATKMGVTSEMSNQEMVERLRSISASEFALGLDIGGPEKLDVTLSIGPRIDGKFFPKSLKDLRKEAPPKKRMIGVCEYEGLIKCPHLKDSLMSLVAFQKAISEEIPDSLADFNSLRDKALDKYFKADIPKRGNKEGYVKLATDLFLGNPIQKNVLNHLSVHPSNEIYLYSFEYFNPNAFPFMLSFILPLKGATHCMEFPYLFEAFIAFGKFNFTENDRKILDITTKLWANFVIYGNPNSARPASEELAAPDGAESSQSKNENGLKFKWLPATTDSPSRSLAIKVVPEMRDTFLENRPRFWVTEAKWSYEQQ